MFPVAKSSHVALDSAPHTTGVFKVPGATMQLDREVELFRGIFVETNKVTQSHGEVDFFIGVE